MNELATTKTKIFCRGCNGTGRIIGRQGRGVPIDHIGCSGRGYYYVEGEQLNELDRYLMCDDQAAQIDCRLTDCRFHQDGNCINASPAITLSQNGKFICWSRDQ